MTTSTEQFHAVAERVVKQFNRGYMTNESECKQYAIEPILQALGWNISLQEECAKEYVLNDQGGRVSKVDYALFDGGRDHPRVFVEAKALGKTNKSENQDQLFRYGANRGVPILVLTDGNTWRLYLAMSEGKPDQREFDNISLTAGGECWQRLAGALDRQAVISGQARLNAEDKLWKRREAEKARDKIPDIWRDLVDSDEMVKQLCDKVYDRTGRRPRTEDVKDFLKRRISAAEGSIKSREAEARNRRSQITGEVPNPQQWSGKIEIRPALEMLAAGKSQKVVGDHFGVSRSRVYQFKEKYKGQLEELIKNHEAEARSRQSHNRGKVPRPQRRGGKIDIPTALEMLDDGKTRSDVARYFKVAPSSVSAMVKRHRGRQ